MAEYTLDEVAKHNTPMDAWVVVNGANGDGPQTVQSYRFRQVWYMMLLIS